MVATSATATAAPLAAVPPNVLPRLREPTSVSGVVMDTVLSNALRSLDGNRRLRARAAKVEKAERAERVESGEARWRGRLQMKGLRLMS